MAISHLNFRSDVLGKATSVTVYLPDKHLTDYPVLYLLHGLSDDCNSWLDATSLARYASAYEFVIVMPQVDLSFYTNMASGDAYWDFLTLELPQKMAQWLPISQLPSHTFVAGQSMGGYGAFKWGMQYPEKFKGVISMSGALDLVSLWSRDPDRDGLFNRIFGDKAHLEASDDNLMRLFSSALNEETAPHFLQICGTEDYLYTDNQTFRHQADKAIKQYTYEAYPGDHSWQFWDQQIQRVLAFCDELCS